MRKIYSRRDLNELLDHVVGVAMMTHESGIQTAEKLGLSSDVISALRDRAIRAANISPCECSECMPKSS